MDSQYAKIGPIFKVLLNMCKLASYEELKGCTDDEIALMKVAQKVHYLPEVYISFMKAVGVNGGRLSEHFWYNYPKALKLKDAALFQYPTRIQKTIELPNDAFVFWESGGLVYFYFHTGDQNPDPAVFAIDESSDEIISKLEETLSQFLFSFVQELSPQLFNENFSTLWQQDWSNPQAV